MTFLVLLMLIINCRYGEDNYSSQDGSNLL